MKGHWLVSALVCVAIGFYFVARDKGRAEPEVGSLTAEHTAMTETSSTADKKSAVEKRRIGDAKALTVQASPSASSPVAGLLPIEETPFLDPDVKSIAATKNDIRRSPVNVGKYLDPNGEYPALSANVTGGIEEASINVGEYLDPDGEPREPPVGNNEDSGNAHSDAGQYLDPDAQFPASGLDPLNQKNVGSLLEVGI